MSAKDFINKVIKLVFKNPFLNLSIVLHFFLIFALTLEFSQYKIKKKKSDELVIVLDSVQIANITNLKLKDTNPGSVNNQTKKFSTTTKYNNQEKLDDVQAPTQVDQPSVIEEAAPKVIKKPKTKPQSGVIEKKPVQTRTLNEDDELASLLQSLDDKTTEGSVQNSGEKSGFIGKGNTKFDEDTEVGISTINAIRSQFIRCWNVPIGAVDVNEVVITINVELDKHGEVISAQIIEGGISANPFHNALAESALRAVYSCSPIKNLQQKDFKKWRNIQLSFSTKEMI